MKDAYNRYGSTLTKELMNYYSNPNDGRIRSANKVDDKDIEYIDILGKYQTKELEQRNIDDTSLEDLVNNMRQTKRMGFFNEIQTKIPEYQALLSTLDLNNLDPEDSQTFTEQVNEALSILGVDPETEEFSEQEFLNKLDYILETQLNREGGSALNAMEQAGFAMGVAFLMAEISNLEQKIRQYESEGKLGNINTLKLRQQVQLAKAETYIHLVIRSRSMTGRVLGSFRNRIKQDYSIERIQFKLNDADLSEVDYNMFKSRGEAIMELANRIEEQEAKEEQEEEDFYDEIGDDIVNDTVKKLNNKKLGLLNRAKMFVKETSVKAAKYFSKFGSKEQRIPAEGFKGGVLNTEDYKESPDKLAYYLFTIFVNDAVKEGKAPKWSEIVKEVQDVLESDGLKHDIKFVKKAIAERALPTMNLKSQYVAFVSLMKTTLTIEEDLSTALKETFDLNKDIVADEQSIEDVVAKIELLLNNLNALSDTVNTIFERELTKKLRDKIENIREQLSQVVNPDMPKNVKTESLKEAKDELRDVRKQLALKKRIAELEKQLEDGVYDIELKKRVKRPYLPSKETLKLLTEKQQLENEVNRRVALLKRKQETFSKKADERTWRL